MAMHHSLDDFTYGDTLANHALSPTAWHELHKHRFEGIIAAAIVFDQQNRILLVRRAEHDFLGGHWEPPGGSLEPGDKSLLHACARELREEAGLTATRFLGSAGEPIIFPMHGKEYYRFTLVVEVQGEDYSSQVRTDPNEHSAWRWATWEEVKAETMEDGTAMPLTFPNVMYALTQAFQIKQAKDETVAENGSRGD